MPFAEVGAIRLCYETLGDPADPPLMMINGVGHQLVYWDRALLEAFATARLYVVVFDNRDVGLSSKLDHLGKARIQQMRAAIARGAPFEVPYGLDSMAADAIGLLDHLDVATGHVLGMSLGGMIAQEMAIRYPDRLRSLISVMSSTGDPRVGRATPEAQRVLFAAPSSDRDEVVAARIEADRIIGSPDHHDDAAARSRAEAAFDRGHHPAGVGRQLGASYRSGNRTKRLTGLAVPTLVVHGTDDPLIAVSGGRATAAAVPGAELVEIEGMGHDLPPAFHRAFVSAVVEFIERVEGRAP